MEFAQDLVNCAPRNVVRSAGLTCWKDLQERGHAGACCLDIPTLLLEDPVRGSVGGLTGPAGCLFGFNTTLMSCLHVMTVDE